MRTISQAVEEIIQRSPFLMEAIGEGIANNAEVARKIKPDVEKRLYEEVSEGAIAMALHRMRKDMQRPQYGAGFLKKMSDITVRSNLIEFSFPNSPDILLALEEVSKQAHRRKDAFFNLSRGVREVLLIVNAELASEVASALKHIRDIQRVNRLSAISMRLPEESLSVPGVYYPVLKALAMEGISLVEVISVRTEFSIIFEDKDVDRAFSVIKKITS